MKTFLGISGCIMTLVCLYAWACPSSNLSRGENLLAVLAGFVLANLMFARSEILANKETIQQMQKDIEDLSKKQHRHDPFA